MDMSSSILSGFERKIGGFGKKKKKKQETQDKNTEKPVVQEAPSLRKISKNSSKVDLEDLKKAEVSLGSGQKVSITDLNYGSVLQLKQETKRKERQQIKVERQKRAEERKANFKLQREERKKEREKAKEERLRKKELENIKKEKALREKENMILQQKSEKKAETIKKVEKITVKRQESMRNYQKPERIKEVEEKKAKRKEIQKEKKEELKKNQELRKEKLAKKKEERTDELKEEHGKLLDFGKEKNVNEEELVKELNELEGGEEKKDVEEVRELEALVEEEEKMRELQETKAMNDKLLKEIEEEEGINSRGSNTLKPVLSYFKYFEAALQNLYDDKKNPDGYLALLVAENKLLYESHLKQKLVELENKIKSTDLDIFQPFYGAFSGHPEFKSEVCKLLFKHFPNEETKKKIQFNPENLVITAGCTQAFDFLSWVLCEDGEEIIVPAPYYAALVSDFGLRSGVKVSPAFCKFHKNESGFTFELTEECLEKAYSPKSKMLVLVNPGNPTGTCYSDEELKMALNWAKKKNLYVLADEIYALGVHSKRVDPLTGTEDRFNSVVNILDGVLGEKVILMYGFSKDLCLSGSRVGFIYTENKNLLQSLVSMIQLGGGSSVLNQLLMTRLLREEEFLDSFYEESRQKLSFALGKVESVLDEFEIPFMKSSSALYLIIDMREKVKKKLEKEVLTFEDENEFVALMADEIQVVLTPGESCCFSEPGFFRLCYAFHQLESVDELRKRFSTFLA
eukprot:augustus_masked-scaffold_21-processed-gene-5.19-mRNA-1 protein AED:1.00 eAED:1.00 QI:0/0/0/0/1/1/2/0/741